MHMTIEINVHFFLETSEILWRVPDTKLQTVPCVCWLFYLVEMMWFKLFILFYVLRPMGSESQRQESSLGDNKVSSDPDHLFLWCSQDQRLKEISMQTPPSASPSSQSIGSANNNHITQTPELFTSSLSTNRYAQENKLFSPKLEAAHSVMELCRKLFFVVFAVKGEAEAFSSWSCFQYKTTSKFDYFVDAVTKLTGFEHKDPCWAACSGRLGVFPTALMRHKRQ